MNLPFFKKNNNNDEYFLGIFLKELEGTVLFMSSVGGKMVVEEKENFTYSNGWENLESDIDEILYRYEKKKNRSYDKTIFFVYSHLVDEKVGDIKQPYLQKIKELVKNLELSALGYIECYEAVSKFIQNKEEIPLTGILVELDQSELTLFVYKGGSMSHKRSVARTDNIAEDMIKGIGDLKGKFLLPSRIILYNSHNLDSSIEKIISYRWDEEYFVQLPRVDIINEEEIVSGLVNVFAEQMGNRPAISNIPEKQSEESFGFLINEDVDRSENETEKEMESTIPATGSINMPKFNMKLPKINLSFLTGKLTILAGLGIIIAALFLNEYFFHNAQLTIFLNSNDIEKSSVFNIDYSVATSSASFTQSTAATGTREIGDPARGQVTIHNFDDGERTFAKSTQIESSGIKFVLDTDVKVASASLATDGSAKLPGKNNVTVTAASIGPEGNLSKGSRFTIAELPSSLYFAINDSTFSGGTKKNIKTVSTKDREKLEEMIISEAGKQIKLPNGTEGSILNSMTKISLTQNSYSKEVGEEGNSVSLTSSALTTFYLYDKNTLLDKIIESIKNDIASGHDVEKSRLNYKINDASILDKDLVKIDVDIKAKSVKKIDETEIIRLVLGKNKKSLEGLKEKLQIQGYEYKINHPIPGLDNFMPIFKKNINIIVTTL